MNAILIKIFATALALSQVTTRPDAVKTHFDPSADRDEVVRILRDGCTHMRKAFDIEDINLDDLITTAMADPEAASGIKSFHGLDFTNLQAAYRQFCRDEPVDYAVFDLGEVVGFYNKAVADRVEVCLHRVRAGGHLAQRQGGGKNLDEDGVHGPGMEEQGTPPA